MSKLYEYLHKKCGGRLRPVWEKDRVMMYAAFICEKCTMYWDIADSPDASLRLPTAKERKEQGLLIVDEDDYPDE